MKAHLLYHILQIHSGEGQALKCAHNRAIEWSIWCWGSLKGGELGLRVNRSGDGLVVKHADTLKKLMRILLWMKEKAIGSPNNLNAEEVVEQPQVLHGEIGTY